MHHIDKGVLFAVSLLFTSIVSAQTSRLDFDQGVSAAEAGNYAEAFCIWKPLADLGHSQAQYRLGWLYAKGLGLAVNEEKAMQWWKLAADLGHADALFSLGWAYHHGEGVNRDIEQAVQYYLQAVEHEHVDAAEILQEMLMTGNKRVIKGLSKVLIDHPGVMGQAGEIAVAKANIRNGPAKQNRLLVTLKKGDPLMVFGEKGNWLRVWVTEKQRFGWVFNRLVKINDTSS